MIIVEFNIYWGFENLEFFFLNFRLVFEIIISKYVLFFFIIYYVISKKRKFLIV